MVALVVPKPRFSENTINFESNDIKHDYIHVKFKPQYFFSQKSTVVSKLGPRSLNLMFLIVGGGGEVIADF